MSTGIGETLREAREAQGRSIEDAAQAVRARTAQLQAIEDDQFGNFGGDVYAKGFIKSYALELGLDPAPLIEQYNREVGHAAESVSSSMVRPVKTPGPKGTTPPAWAAWVLVAAVVVGGLYFLGLITPGSTPDQAAEDIDTPPVPSAPGTEEPEEPGDEPEDVTEETGTNEEEEAPDPEEQAAEEGDEPEFEGVEVIFALERRSWMRVTVDGAVILEETVAEGETLRYEGDEVIVRIGDAAGVRIQHNGEDLGPAGGSGEVVDLRFTEDGVEDV